jgi:hypothetical protein
MVNSIAMPVSRKMMEMHQNRHIRQVEHATKQWEARANKVANNNNRRQWLERQNNASYRNEYDRLRGELSHYRIPYGSVHRLRSRQQELDNLFSSGNV